MTACSPRSLQTGDVLLVPHVHTAMYVGNDQIAQARIDEHGNAFGGASGRTGGRETVVCPYYDRPWKYVLRFHGTAQSHTPTPGNRCAPACLPWTVLSEISPQRNCRPFSASALGPAGSVRHSSCSSCPAGEQVRAPFEGSETCSQTQHELMVEQGKRGRGASPRALHLRGPPFGPRSGRCSRRSGNRNGCPGQRSEPGTRSTRPSLARR
jgi:hypothetical protein